jgi:hypothetical protein
MNVIRCINKILDRLIVVLSRNTFVLWRLPVVADGTEHMDD